MRSTALVFASLLLLAAPPATHAESVNVAGRTVDVPVPAGYCVLKDGAAEGPILDRLRYGLGKGNRLLLAFANCDELKAMRAAKAGTAEDGFDDYATVAVVLENGEPKLLDGVGRPQFLERIIRAMSNGQVIASALKRAEERVRHVRDIRQTESLGVLDNDANAVYIGLTGLNAETDQHVLAVGGATLVKGMNVYFTVYKILKGPGDVSQLLTLQKANLGSFVAANR